VIRIAPGHVRRAIDATLVVLVTLVGIIALISVIGPSLGYRPFLIRGSSMEPAIPRGAVAIASEDPGGTIRAGDVVSFTEANGIVVTHRVVSVDGTGPAALLTTKGDANAAADPAPIPAARVLGRVVGSVPYLGYVAAMLTMPVGLLSIALLAVGLLIVGMLAEELGRGPCAACAGVQGMSPPESDSAGATA
jgi:signal peptidase I